MLTVFSAAYRRSFGHMLLQADPTAEMVDTVRDTYDWVGKARADGSYQPRPNVGPTPEQEAEILSAG